ncbi:DUF6634 family protein [Devosia salina]|uniref:Uncharacterized protein n=1 Tax=Devosia salina TaxID=2860336 RepID=A0ABX8WFT8_9HYPH|nr:DUF6634 family protein [Devosia salina]QYO77753.1 hypothetical protein K1X15_04070 [Devosia salina]
MMILPPFDIAVSNRSGSIGLMDLDRLIDVDDDKLSEHMRRKIAAARKSLQRLRAGWCPGPDILELAPRLHDWRFIQVEPRGTILVGTVIGHPRLGDRPYVQTSYLIGLDATHLKWARTLSRFYVLGEPMGYPVG